ncbi:PEP-CTERM sorting domain-containing protein [Desulfurivibrio sp. D14AmB]|uniref:PEP-CTERM sorting domain-containing protein n=1 Tax=Desulfurivibrio sp. D14AmB TaxID=3374370 RepID=UPI00376EA70A
MRRIFGWLLLAIFLIPSWSMAAPVAEVDLKMSYSSPTGKVTFPGPVTGTYYLDYDAELTWDGTTHSLEIFCVENVPGTTANVPYQLYTLDSLGDIGLDSEKYLTAAWIAEQYYDQPDNQDYWKAMAQIAIWEVIFDFGSASGLDVTTGSFRSHTYTQAPQAILAGLPASIPSSSLWLLAVNPDFQNYLVRNPAPVPEPASMLLFATGLAGLAGFRRRQRRLPTS